MHRLLTLVTQLLRGGKDQPDSSIATDNTRLLGETNSQAIAENSADVILQLGPDIRARYVSPSCFNVLGYTQEEIIGRGAADFVHKDDLPEAELLLSATVP